MTAESEEEEEEEESENRAPTLPPSPTVLLRFKGLTSQFGKISR
jgi:hypothetical protein